MSAVIAQNALSMNERDMTQAMERLSTGQRINSAADDAGGLAIGARMASQITGLSQAARNANDGVSMIQTAEAAYVEVSDMLQRMRQIAVQSASETYATSDRTALDLEFQALADEIKRIAEQTTWNGLRLLDGTAGTVGTVKVHSGANASQTVDVDVGTLSGKAVDANGLNTISDSSGALSTSANGSFTQTVNLSATTVHAASKAISISNFASLQAADELMFTLTEHDGLTSHSVALTLSSQMVANIKAGSADALDDDVVISDDRTLANIGGDIGKVGNHGASGGGHAASVNETPGTYPYATNSNSIDFLGITIDSTTTAGEFRINGLANNFTFDYRGDFTISNMKVRRGNTSLLEIADVKKQTSANKAISLLDTVIQKVNSQRASYGSYISRLEHVSTNLTNIATNTTQSKSRVVDTNYATETTELARTQIIRQAATAMLAQANQMKQTVLALLQ